MSVQQINMLNIADFGGVLKKSILASLKPKDVVNLHEMCEMIRVDPGDCLRRVGDMSSAMYLVASGKIRLTEPTMRKNLAVLGTGGSFGMLSLLCPSDAYIEAYAEEQSQLIVLDAGNLRMIEVSNPQLAIVVLRALREAVIPNVSRCVSIIARTCTED